MTERRWGGGWTVAHPFFIFEVDQIAITGVTSSVFGVGHTVTG